MSAAATFIKDLAKRRSIYALSKNNFPLSNDQVTKIVQGVVRETPSAFNSQTNRAVILFGAQHDKLWNQFAVNALKPIVPADGWASTEARLKGFAGGYGTVLLYEDTKAIKALQEKFALYAEKFPQWAAHSQGAATISLWQALALENVGANLQHYNPLIDEAAAKEWGIPAEWELTGQLVFGSIEAPAGDKSSLPADEVIKTKL